MTRLRTSFVFRFALPLLSGLIGCASTSPPQRHEVPVLPGPSDLQQMRQAIDAGEVHLANKQYGEARQEFKHASDLASRALQTPITPEGRLEAAAGRDKANLERARVLAVLADDQSRPAVERKAFLSDAKVALNSVDNKYTEDYRVIASEVERLAKDPQPSAQSIELVELPAMTQLPSVPEPPTVRHPSSVVEEPPIPPCPSPTLHPGADGMSILGGWARPRA